MPNLMHMDLQPVTLLTGESIDPRTLVPNALGACAAHTINRLAGMRDILSPTQTAAMLSMGYYRFVTLLEATPLDNANGMLMSEMIHLAAFAKRYRLLETPDLTQGALPDRVQLGAGRVDGVPAPAPVAVGEAVGNAVQYATGEQKQEIVRLVNHALITRPEKTKMLLSLNVLSGDRAQEVITNLNRAITLREAEVPQ